MPLMRMLFEKKFRTKMVILHPEKKFRMKMAILHPEKKIPDKNGIFFRMKMTFCIRNNFRTGKSFRIIFLTTATLQWSESSGFRMENRDFPDENDPSQIRKIFRIRKFRIPDENEVFQIHSGWKRGSKFI